VTGPQPESLVSIVMVNWHSSALVKKCLESVASSPGIIKYIQEIIIVDNSSGDRGLASIRCGEVAIHHMHNTANVGFGRACNQGGAISKGKYLLFLNPDTELNQNSLRIPFEFLDSRENLNYAACGLQLRSDNDEVARTCTYLPSAYSFAIGALGIAHVMPFVDDRFHMLSWPHDSDKDVAHIIGAFYLIRAHIFKDIGGFDERFIVYLEDLDLSARLASAGWKIRYLASATISHVGGGTSSKILPARLYTIALQSKTSFRSGVFHDRLPDHAC